MNKRSLLVIIALAVAAVVAGFWLGARRLPEPSVSTRGEKPSTEPLPVATPAPRVAQSKQPPGVQKEKPVEIPQWEMQIDQILRSNVNETQTAQILISTLPSLPAEGQVEAGHHISNLLPDSDYSRLMPILLNPSMPEPVLSVFVTDLMNRNDTTKLRALLEVAKVANHPFHDEAMSTLQVFLGEDYGNDWGKWQEAMDKYLGATAAPPVN